MAQRTGCQDLASTRADKRPTLTDVARMAHCSPITASRAINTPGVVSADLRERVMAAVERLGYLPNLNARALASTRTHVVGVIVPSLAQHIFSDVLRGVYDAVQPTSLRVHLGNTHYDSAEEERLIGEFLRHKPAAMIVSGVDQSPLARSMLADAGCTVVQMMDLTADPIDRVVGFSHVEAGYIMTRHLIDQGYRRIGYLFLVGWMNTRSAGRLQGWKQALEEADLYDPSLLVTRTSEDLDRQLPRERGEVITPLHARAGLRELLTAKPKVDAVFCNNDPLALGVLFEAIAQGLRVPEDLGVAGFNDSDMILGAHPSLTSLRTPRYEIGFRAVEEALAVMQGQANPERVTDLGTKVSFRRSTDRLGQLSADHLSNV
ncbi:LacI family DNA-binding transcriptional regulator [Rubellimicrobium rubrum]|uniref:LacI family DNA-binding transcriptional regulator n=1 Tax=Rubellimicrobium rubrum TaxID=2585369 RepID=A0A5C4MVK3_9RHOB|nr:LacI family DNA-binding transcriptional regulator [Rubellimicrobium rubrum]TNC48703.1 LacI family DNA-binding transcriptional regulator [Rubellimicrobium rubrum]